MMEDLPVPLSRVELYLAKACGMDVTVPEAPESRLEQYLAILAGDTSIEMPAPLSLTEQWLAYILGVTPDPLLAVEGACYIDNQKVDVRYFAVAAGMPGAVLPPAPQNRKEQYFANLNVGPSGVLKYATGIDIALTDVVRGLNSLENIYGDTYQLTSSGKNLFTTASHDPNSVVPIDANSFSITKSQSSYYQINLSLPAGTYTFSCDVEKNSSNLYGININIYNTDGAGYSAPSTSGHISYKIVSSSAIERVLFRFDGRESYPSGVTVKNLQIESGSTETPFEPYTGGVAIPNPDSPQTIHTVTGEQTVGVHGKNIWSLASSFSNSSTINRWVLPDTAVLIPAGTYTFSCDIETDNNIQFAWKYADDASHYTIFTNGKATVTFTEEVKKVAIRMQGPNSISNIQLELGSTATDYQPYQSATYTINLGSIELCKIGDYQDYIYKSGNDWYVHKAIKKAIFTGAEAWALAAGTYPFRHNIPDAISPLAVWQSEPPLVFVNSFSTIAWLDGASQQPDYCVSNSASNNTLAVRDVDFTTVSEFQTYLSTNNMIVYYPLATPTDTKITDNTLIGQLEAVNNATLPTPVATISVTTDGTSLPGALKISYYGEEE